MRARHRDRKPPYRRRLAGAGLPLLLAAGCAGVDAPLPDLPPVAPAEREALVARGEYVVRTLSVCGHCHAADTREPDGPLSGGFAFRNWRLGTIRASNLTPDSATGLGAWTEAEIVRALRTGVRRDGRLLAPVMPYQWFHAMGENDALAVALYLRSLSPVSNRIESSPGILFRLSRGLLLGTARAAAGPPPPRGPTAAYGRYLANHVALCADCHTPRTGLMQTHDRRRLLAGEPSPPTGFPANPPNLTPDPGTGLGRWSEEDFARAMRTGVTPAGDTLHRFMPWPQFRRMTGDDLTAIYRYLRELEPVRQEVPRGEP